MTVKAAHAAKAVEAAQVETTHEAAQTGFQAILHSADTWLIVAFVIFLGIFVKYVLPAITKNLDARADTIRQQLEQASRLRAEAQALLASYQEQQAAMLKEAEAIVATAQSDAVQIRANAAEDLKQALDRRSQQAHEKIARAELEAIAHIRGRIIELATDEARTILAQEAPGAQDKEAIARAIAAIEQQIH